MVIYPRSLAGLTLNPNKKEQQYQENEVEILLKRLKLKTYLNRSGWDILLEHFEFDNDRIVDSSVFDYQNGTYYIIYYISNI